MSILEDVITFYEGEPTKRSSDETRWRKNHSLSLCKVKECWNCFESEAGGYSIITFIMLKENCDKRTAIEKAKNMHWGWGEKSSHKKTGRLSLTKNIAPAKPEGIMKATAIIKETSPADISHPYLKNKGLKSNYGALQHHEIPHQLIIPVLRENQYISLQYISDAGQKRFLKDATKQGGAFIIGKLTQRILICEGFATGATLHEMTGDCVFCAFDAGNLLHVCKQLQNALPEHDLLVCADNDWEKEKNVGITTAKRIKRVLGISGVAPPDLSDCSDFNDYYRLKGDFTL